MAYGVGLGSHLSKAEIVKIASRLEDPSQWIERRVESLTFLDDGSTRRRISFDYIVLPEFLFLGFVPLALFRKEDLSSLDVRAANGHAISILTTYDAADLAIRLLQSGVKSKLDDDANLLIEEIVFFKCSVMDESLFVKERDLYRRYVNLVTPENSSNYVTLAQSLLRTFILWVQLPEGAKPYQRLITKVSYEEVLPFEGMFPPLPVRTVVHPNWSSRFHFEVTAPPELKISALTIRSAVKSKSLFASDASTNDLLDEASGDSVEVFAQISGGSFQVGHVSMDGYPELPPVQADIEIIPSSGGTAKIAFMVVIATMAVFLVPTLFKITGSALIKTPKDGTAAALLLLGPALLVAYLARSPEHPIVAHRMRGARYSLLACGVLLMMAASLLGGIVGEEWLRTTWYALTGMATLVVCLFLYWGRKSKLGFLSFKLPPSYEKV